MKNKVQSRSRLTQGRLDVIEWLTATEAAQHLKVKPRTLLLWVRQDKVKGYKLSGTKRHVWRFQRMDLDAALFDSTAAEKESPDARSSWRFAVSLN
jgi:excisionase family DNA binding protein